MARRAAVDRHVKRDEAIEFLRARHFGILSTRRRGGGVQMSPVTMGVDADGRVVVSTYPDRAKSHNARRDPRVSICVLSDDLGDEWTQVDGTAEVLALPEALEPLVDYYRAISGEHPDWDEYREAMRQQGKVLIRVTIDRCGPISRGGFPPRLVEQP